MIDWEITKHETGVDKDYFDKRSKSHKRVCRICDKCHNVSWVEFKDSNKLCRSCSLIGRSLTDKHKQNISKGVIANGRS